MASSWQPSEQGVQQICSLLHEYLKPGVDQARIFQELERCKSIPDFNNYLAFILCRGEGQPVVVRQSAGLLLKNNLHSAFQNVAPAFLSDLKSQLLPCIGAPDKQIRTTVGSVISVLVHLGGVHGWPELMTGIAQCLDSGDYAHIEGALDALYKICEDVPYQLDSDVPGLPERPVNAFIPRLLALFSSPHASLRRMSLASVNHFVLHMPKVLLVSMDTYLQGLFRMASDESSEVRRLVCSALVQLVEVQPDFLQPHIRNVVQFMLQANQEPDTDVALESCEFWSTYCEARLPPEVLREFLPQLVNILLTNMVYADDDEAILEAEDDGDVQDSDKDLKPRFHQARLHGGGDGGGEGQEGGGEEEEDEDDAVGAWTLRKCSAASLDTLSYVFKEELLPVLMPLVQTRLSSTSPTPSAASDSSWKEREAAVLAMGAVAEGCINGLLPALPQIVSSLLPLLDDSHPLVRSISCWSLSRFSKWIVQGVETPAGQEQFDRVLSGLLNRILDGNKKVQEAACSAFATLEEEAVEELPSRLEPILQHLMFAFGKYQRRNLRILYDAIGTLADSVGAEMQQPRFVELLLPPLLAKWQALADSDRDLLPLLECLTSIAQALRASFQPFAAPIFSRCCNIIRTQQGAKAQLQAQSQQQLQSQAPPSLSYDPEFVICCLDLLSGLTEGLGSSIEPLLSSSDLQTLLLVTCGDDATDVRQSAFALMGDLAKASAPFLRPKLADYLTIAVAQLQGSEAFAFERLSVANNACWAIGEIAVKLPEDVAPIIPSIVPSLAQVLATPQATNRSLVENSAVTLGRLGSASASTIAPHASHFLAPWCNALKNIRDDIEKEDAFRGLCAIIRTNPAGATPYLSQLCNAIASWHVIYNEALRSEIGQVLQGVKQMVGEAGWQQCFASLDPAVREKLVKSYGV